MEIILISVIIILIALSIFLYKALIKALNGIDVLENVQYDYNVFLEKLDDQLKLTINEMREIDINGAFESDDEVGSVFEQLKAMVEMLEVFRTEERHADENEDVID